jgi:hypothetical protein
MVTASVLIGSVARTRVPRLTHLRRAAAQAAARRAHVKLHFSARYDAAPSGTVIAQHPGARANVAQGTAISAVLSRGPAPVKLPGVLRQRVTDAQGSLTSLGLHTTIRQVPRPGTAPGTVVAQSPAGGLTVKAHSTVTLSVAEQPRWRPVTSFTGIGSGTFTIRGDRWRLVYDSADESSCSFIFFCNDSSVRVVSAASGAQIDDFSLSDGTGRTRVIASGPGRYEVQVSPASSHARWSMQVQDHF